MIRIRKGLTIPITGLPEQKINDGNPVRTVALLGDDYVGIKPTMLVTEGDAVLAGQPLFSNKKIPIVSYSAPVSGQIVEINRGHKRKLQSVVIECNDKEGISFDKYEHSELSQLSGESIRSQLLASGLWTALRTRPLSKVPDPDSKPHSIFVNAMDTRPLSADPAVIINEYESDFSAGLALLHVLSGGTLYLITAPNVNIPSGATKQKVFCGPHPAGLPGTHIHHIDPVSATKTVWQIDYQDVIAFGKLFTTGYIWQERIIALAGPQVSKPRIIRTLPGACLDDVVANELREGNNRIISGSVLGGTNAVKPVNFLGRYHTQVSVLKEGTERSLFHYLSPGINRFSVLPIYLSRLFKKRFDMTTSSNGSPRAMVPVGSYEKVMPLDILPTQLLRSLIVGDIDTAEKLGMLELDEEDLALCTFVCPGKYEYGPILRDNLTKYEKEV